MSFETVTKIYIMFYLSITPLNHIEGIIVNHMHAHRVKNESIKAVKFVQLSE